MMHHKDYDLYVCSSMHVITAMQDFEYDNASYVTYFICYIFHMCILHMCILQSLYYATAHKSDTISSDSLAYLLPCSYAVTNRW